MGGDYRLRSWPLTLGGNVNWNPDYETRRSQEQLSYQGVKRVVDVYGLWRVSAATGLRLSVSNYETLAANAVRRALRVGETDVAPRVSDLAALAASTSGKIEIESMEEGRESQILQNFVKAAVLQVFKKRVSSAKIGEVIALFEGGVIAHAGEDIASAQYVELFNQVPPLRELVVAAVGNTDSVAQIASGVEFVLEGLHLSKRLNKDESGSRATYRSRT